MALEWIPEAPPYWNADKERVVRGAPEGSLHLGDWSEATLLPGDWFRVEDDGSVVGYGWLDTIWGDAEISLVVSPDAQNKGVGNYILEHLAAEAKGRGLLYMFNAIPADHPNADGIRKWLEKRGFAPSEDGRLLRRATRS